MKRKRRSTGGRDGWEKVAGERDRGREGWETRWGRKNVVDRRSKEKIERGRKNLPLLLLLLPLSLCSGSSPCSSLVPYLLFSFPSLSSFCFCLIIFSHLPPLLLPSLPPSYIPSSLPPLWFSFQTPAVSICLYINNFWWQTPAFSSLTCQPEAWHAHFLISFHFPFFFFLFFSLHQRSERSLRQVDVKFCFLLSVEINTLYTPPPHPPTHTHTQSRQGRI